MDPSARALGGREFGGTMTGLLVAHVREHAGDEGVGELLRIAGLERSAAELEDEKAWFSYDEVARLFDAAADVLDDPDFGRLVGRQALRRQVGSLLVLLIRSLGTPAAAFRALDRLASRVVADGDLAVVEVGRQHAVVTYTAFPEFPRTKPLCDLAVGILAEIPAILGLPEADVAHPQCQAFGAPACVYRVRWKRLSRLPWRAARQRVEYAEQQAALVTRQFNALQDATVDLVSAGDVSGTLHRIATRAADAVRARSYLLVVDGPEGRTVHHDGFTDADALAAADELLGGGGASRDALVVAVESERRRYGYLAAYAPDGGGFFHAERQLLSAYARTAAAALDTATAFADARAQAEEARRRGETAAVLLDLAGRLADAGSVTAVCRAIADAVPTVIGADRAAVLLWDPEHRIARGAAATGFGNELDRLAADITIADADTPILAEMLATPDVRLFGRDEADPFVRRMLALFDAETLVVVPIVARGAVLGAVVANWAPGSEQPMASHIGDRLTGLARQAGTALLNARLLDHIRYQAFHDELTGLPNQTVLRDRVEQALAHARRTGSRFAMLYLDLDRFKNVNDSLGHGAGDELLRQTASRLAAALREEDTVARLGGDEFAVLLLDTADADGAACVARKILDAFEAPFLVAGQEVFVTPSIGCVVAPDDGDRFSLLLKHADAAMYKAKEVGATFRLYASALGDEAANRLAIESELRSALARNELAVVYQPQVDLTTRAIVGLEALVRWDHPVRGRVAPDSFVPLAEETGLIVAIDRWVLHRACEDSGRWAAAGLLPGRIAVNLSGRHFTNPDALAELVEQATSLPCDPRRLEFEITESVAVREAGLARQGLEALRAAGATVAVDDFGTGYSRLARLQLLPVDKIKIDRSLVATIRDGAAEAPLVDAAIAIGRSLHLDVVAEGVETDAQAAYLAAAGCGIGQGYALGEPLEPGEVERVLEARAARAAGLVS